MSSRTAKTFPRSIYILAVMLLISGGLNIFFLNEKGRLSKALEQQELKSDSVLSVKLIQDKELMRRDRMLKRCQGFDIRGVEKK